MGDLTVEQVIGIHRKIMERDGGDSRIVSEANLLQLVFYLNSKADYREKAALALFLLTAYPSFREGNKRTGCTLAQFLLNEGGYRLLTPVDELIKLVAGITDFTIEQDEIGRWIYNNTKKTDGSRL